MASIELDNLPFPADDIADTDRNASLGRFMTAWAQVEVVCGFLFRELTGMESDVSMVVFDRMKNREQIEVVSDLAGSIADPILAENLIAEMKSAGKFAEKRNKITHARWGKFNGAPARFWSSLTQANFTEIQHETDSGKSLRSRSIHTTDDLNALTEQLIACRDNLQAFIGKIGAFTESERDRLMRRLADAQSDKLQVQIQLHDTLRRAHDQEFQLRAIGRQHPE